jgi:hypothetical protein
LFDTPIRQQRKKLIQPQPSADNRAGTSNRHDTYQSISKYTSLRFFKRLLSRLKIAVTWLQMEPFTILARQIQVRQERKIDR